MLVQTTNPMNDVLISPWMRTNWATTEFKLKLPSIHSDKVMDLGIEVTEA